MNDALALAVVLRVDDDMLTSSDHDSLLQAEHSLKSTYSFLERPFVRKLAEAHLSSIEHPEDYSSPEDNPSRTRIGPRGYNSAAC